MTDQGLSQTSGTMSPSRAWRVARAQELRADGLKLREIADQMGVKLTTVGTWLSDPDLSKQRARRAGYAAPCELCGEPTDGSGGYATRRSICQTCRTWPEDAVIDAMRRWAESHGGCPPTTADWRRADVDHPCANVVTRRFGWNRLLLEAGFALRCDRRPETHEWIVEQLRAGRRVEDIADDLGVTAGAIWKRLAWRGLSMAEVRAA